MMMITFLKSLDLLLPSRSKCRQMSIKSAASRSWKALSMVPYRVRAGELERQLLRSAVDGQDFRDLSAGEKTPATLLWWEGLRAQANYYRQWARQGLREGLTSLGINKKKNNYI